MRRIARFPDRMMKRRQCHTHTRSRLSMMCSIIFGMLLLPVFTGCDRAPAPAEEGKLKHSSDHARLVRLPVDEVTRSCVTVVPGQRIRLSHAGTIFCVVRPRRD